MPRLALVAIALSAVALTGCATTAESTAAAPPPADTGAQTVTQDHAYMQQVEQIARRRGIGVTWINPPIKRKVRTTN